LCYDNRPDSEAKLLKKNTLALAIEISQVRWSAVLL